VAPLIVAMAFGLSPNAGMLLVPFVGFVTGFGFASFGVLVAAVAKTIDNFNYVTSAVLTPLFLVAGTFFPISTFPPVLRAIAELNPLYHCVQLVRDAALGLLGVADLGHAAFLVVFAVVMWRIAVWQMELKLID
jgi:lipooligosaccharide transport system permease protein